MKITDILQPSAILLNTTFATKDAALDAMIDALASGGHITKVEEARKAVFDREKIMAKVLPSRMARRIISQRPWVLS
jgi:mannitol/fructose-specific phosphotransferase system IIA component (Ntr-type)